MNSDAPNHFVQKSNEEHVLVFLSIISKNQILESNFDLDPFIETKRRPHVMCFRDGGFVWFHNNFASVRVDMQSSQNQDKSGEGLNGSIMENG